LMREVPAGERELYKEFAKTVQDEYGVFIPLISGSNSDVAANPTGSAMNALARLRSLPDSSNHEATRLEGEARTALTDRDLQTAVSSLYRAVAADPKFTRAWLELGQILFTQMQNDAALDAFHKAIAADPDEPAVPKAVGYGLMASNHFADAVTVWLEYIKAHPDDGDGLTNLGNCLMALKKYPDAAAAFESAIGLEGNRADEKNSVRLESSLGSAYLFADQREKAATAFKKVAEMNPDGLVLNNIAYQMAGADLELPLALQFAEKAVRQTEEESQKITLPGLSPQDLVHIFTLSAYWDTLGWVSERMSNFGPAEQYLLASWKLTQDGVVAGHLCHLYRRTHQTAAGIQMCRLAIARIPMSQTLSLSEYQVETKAAEENLAHITGGAKSPAGPEPSDIVIHERTFNLPRFLLGTESAEFFLLFSSDATSKAFKVADVKFISGSDKMKNQGKQQLMNLHFKFPTPDGVASRFVKRGILGCYQYSGCSFVLLDQASVKSLN
jgi:tetratricopeptide (TPR) repeat protein